jgi:uncharacterized protein YfaP (DUF2135 family)
MKTLKVILFWASTIIFFSCGKKGEVLPAKIDPANASQLSQVIIMPSGSERANGNSPSSSTDSQAPRVISGVTSVISSNGGTVPLSFTYQNVNGNLAGCYVQIEGADTYYTVPYPSTSGSSGRLSLPITLPTNLIAGKFRVRFSVYDRAGRVSVYQIVEVNVLELGTGALQISLSWDTPTDQDLYVTDPTGTIIYFGNKTSPSGGELDRDDLDGYGPENIFWLTNTPDGTYSVRVRDYNRTSTPNNCYVTINTPNKNKTYNVTTQSGRTVDVVTFTKTGENYSF